MSEGFLLIDRRTNLLSCNASALRLLGAPRSCAGESVLLLSRAEPFRRVVVRRKRGAEPERKKQGSTGALGTTSIQM